MKLTNKILFLLVGMVLLLNLTLTPVKGWDTEGSFTLNAFRPSLIIFTEPVVYSVKLKIKVSGGDSGIDIYIEQNGQEEYEDSVDLSSTLTIFCLYAKKIRIEIGSTDGPWTSSGQYWITIQGSTCPLKGFEVIPAIIGSLTIATVVVLKKHIRK